jgi:hypothetical protein
MAPTTLLALRPDAVLAAGQTSSGKAWIFYVFLGVAVVIGIGLIGRFVLGRGVEKRATTPKSNDRPQR